MNILPATKLVTNIGRMKPCIAGSSPEKPVLLTRSFDAHVLAKTSFQELPACAICVEWHGQEEGGETVFVDPRGQSKEKIEQAVRRLRNDWNFVNAREPAVLKFRTIPLTMHFERIPADALFAGLGYGGSPFFRHPANEPA